MNNNTVNSPIHSLGTYDKHYGVEFFNINKPDVQCQLLTKIQSITILFIIGIFISFNSKAFGFNIHIQASDLLPPLLLAVLSRREGGLKKGFSSFEMKAIFLIFTSILFLGAIIHWLNFGAINFWGIKKLIGWSICVGYLLAGFLLYEKRQHIIQILIVTAWVLGALCLIGCSLSYTKEFFVPGQIMRIQGFMKNPNAYGIFVSFVLLIQISINDYLPYKKQIKRIGMFILTINLIGTTSRTSIIGFMCCYILFLLKNNNPKKYFFLFVTFIIIFSCTMLVFIKNQTLIKYFNGITSYFGYIHYSFCNNFAHSLNERINGLSTIFPAFSEHFITGIGLGGAMTLNHAQEQFTIHNTALWFLIEMGIIGFAVFAWFAYKLTTALRTSHDIYIKALTLPLLSFAIASLANELFYQRYFWFFVGMIMCDYTKRSRKETALPH